MNKIVIIGAGSQFGTRLSKDIMTNEHLKDSTICLCDIHEGRLAKVANYLDRIIKEYQLPTKIIASTKRKELLPNADFVITSISAGGYSYWGEPYKSEVLVPRKYGVDQCVADTCGVGAVFRFLRTGPVQLQIVRDVEELCPDALILNHTNPMQMLTWMHYKASKVRFIGLCHSVQNTLNELASFLGLEVDEIQYNVFGTNHMAWFISLKKGDEDLYNRLREKTAQPSTEEENKFVSNEKVRIELMNQFGFFVTESSVHNSEYQPYFRRNKELLDEYHLITPTVNDVPPKDLREWMKPENSPLELQRSGEYTTGIMESTITDKPFYFSGNVRNTGLISNLSDDCCVEVPCISNASGIYSCHMGKLPSQLAALNQTNIIVHELAVNAVLNKDREAAFHACALDPLASSVVSLKNIRKMFDELWKAEEKYLLWFDPNHKNDVPEMCGL